MNVLDHGFIRLVDCMGTDASVVQAARVSYGAGTKTPSDDRTLIRYLMRHQHTTPFEMCELKFHCRMPISVARQWIRHRTASVNEYSTRYSEPPDEIYVPAYSDLCKQSATNKQGRDEPFTDGERMVLTRRIIAAHVEARTTYNQLIAAGLARESARDVLPLAQYTEWYWKANLHNVFRFLKLRMDEHAQYEIRQYANAMAEIVESQFPVCWEAFQEYVFNAVTFSATAMLALVKACEHAPTRELISGRISDTSMSSRERVDVLRALGIDP